MIVAIHQPNFFPWLGYFGKIARCDVFCLMDNAQFSRGSWTNRVRIRVSGAPAWITVPVRRGDASTPLIRDVRICDEPPWRDKLLRSLQTNYGACPFFAQVFPLIRELIHNPESSLAAFNEHAVRRLCAALGLTGTTIILGSTLHALGQGTELLIDMVRKAGGSAYLSGDGSAGYLDPTRFAQAGMHLQYQRFAHPQYPQHAAERFEPGLSVVDALFNCGFDGTARLLQAPFGATGGEVNGPTSRAAESSAQA